MAKIRAHPPSASSSTASTNSPSTNPTEISSGIETESPIVLVLGLTGAGKTTFINHVTNSSLAVGRGMDACTTTSACAFENIDGVEVAFVDTPGFDDPEKSDADILIDITKWIEINLGGKKKVTAALYLHSILTKKMHGSAHRNFSLFSSLVGTESMTNVGLVSTHWDVAAEEDAIDREVHLSTNAWSLMLNAGARKYRLHNDLNSAQSMVVDMLKAQPSFIQIQKEMAKEFQGKPLSRTEAGEGVYNELLDRISKEKRDVLDIERQLAEDQFTAPKQREAFKKQLGKAKSRLGRLEVDRQRVEKVPSWGETIWSLTKTHGLGVGMQAFQYITASAAAAAAAGATAEKIARLEADLAASQAAAQAASHGHTTSYATVGAAVGVGIMALRLLGWA